MFLKGTVSPHNPKTLRASAGSLFRLPVLVGMDAGVARAAIETRRLDLYAAMPVSGLSLPEADLTRRFAVVVGSEGRGVSAALRERAINLLIPTTAVESLNAAMAAGIVLYEARRQRMKK
jgi:TrmH family RNA methyltransferase